VTPAKRLFDVIVALILAVLLSPLIAAVALGIALCDGRPVLYLSERMKTPTRGFALAKFRTMTLAASDAGVSGGDKAARITRLGRLLRRSRLDELPQLWNVLRGDISFVGPRPPLREYVERFPALYARVLASRPGITGLATLRLHRHEERLLARCTTPQETDRVYCSVCIPRKARLDLLYQRRRTLCWDVLLMLQTALSRG
jgi:lipopolysaccharide/colanic/teichoic acid biosynthesis glycosyltransferase